MSVPRGKTITLCVLLVLLTGSAGSLWRVRAQTRSASRPTPVQPLTGRIPPPPVTSGDRGGTYHSLERQAIRVTTRFADAVARAERTADGELSTHLTSLAGADVGAFKVHHVDAEIDSLEFTMAEAASTAPTHVARRSGLRPTLDWTNEQLYSLWKDRDALGSSLEWQDTLMRPAGAARRNVGETALQTDTEWQGGFSATVIRKIGTHISYLTDRRTTGVVFISRFRKDGVEVGSSQWWPGEQAFAWSFPGLTADSFVTAAHLKQNGGWNFTPDMAWLNMQNLAFFQFGTLLKTDGAVSRNREGGWFGGLVQLVAPSLSANEPGCDGLHWMDGTILRWCCDIHDACYVKDEPACTASSWWQFWTSWRCDFCNLDAIYCFASGGGHIFQKEP